MSGDPIITDVVLGVVLTLAVLITIGLIAFDNK